jgi:hypothetical protein
VDRDRCGRWWLEVTVNWSSRACRSVMVAGWLGWARSQCFIVCWNRSTLPQVVGWLGLAFCCATCRRGSSAWRALRPPLPPARRVVNTIALSVRVDAGCRGRRPRRGRCRGDRSGDAGPGGQVQGGAGVVVEPGEDLGVGGVGEPVVGEVGLPGLVGKGCLEADLGRAGPFLGLRDDQAVGSEVAADRRSRHGELVVLAQVPGDGVGPGVEALLGQLFPQPDDQLDGVGAGRGG